MEGKGLKFEVDYDNNKLKIMTVYDIEATEADPQIIMEIPVVSVLQALKEADFTPSWADKALNLLSDIMDKAPEKES